MTALPTVDWRDRVLRVPGKRAIPMKRHEMLCLDALLAMYPKWAGLDELVDKIWDDDLPERPQKVVQWHVANLRKLMRGIGWIIVHDRVLGYRLLKQDEA